MTNIKKYANTKPQEGRQLQAFTTKVDFMIYGGARGAGKALPLDSEVHTPNGLKTISDLQEGDQVFGQNGKPVEVIKLHPVSTQEGYKITFEDGTEVICSPDHLWNTWLADKSLKCGKEGLQQTVDTKTLTGWVDKAKGSTGSGYYPLISLCDEVALPTKDVPIDPYLLGLLLGNGCTTRENSLEITSNNKDIVQYLDKNYYTSVSDRILFTDNRTVRFIDDSFISIRQELIKLGLYGEFDTNKIIPSLYLSSSIEQRYELLRGLLDTSSDVQENGQVRYSHTSESMVKEVKSLVESLGGICIFNKNSGRCINTEGVEVEYTYSYTIKIKHKEPDRLFKLHKKLSSTKVCQSFSRKIIDITKVDSCLMRCITVDDESGLFLTGRNCVVTHNSQLLAMRPLEFVNDPYFTGIFFRREHGELIGANGLWDKSCDMYPEFGGKSNISNLWWKFPSGAKVAMKHMHTEANKETHRGLGYSMIGFDEIDQFSQEQVQFLLTCLRSEADMDSFCIGTCNPNYDSWVYPLVKWYLDADGSPDPEKYGVIRHFIVLDGEFVFGDSEDYFKENYESAVYVDNTKTGERLYVPPKTFCFLAGTVFDNPALIAANPRYLSELQNLPDHQRKRELYGNWHARPKGAFYFDRKWIQEIDRVPKGSLGVRGYDLAAVAVSEKNKYPDATTSVNYWKCPNGYFYITGNYHPDFKDLVGSKEIGGRMRVQIGTRSTVMMKQAELDGKDVIQVIPEDPAAAGKQAYQEIAKQFAAVGARCKKDPIANNKGKLTKFLPFADAAENGLVYIVRNTFPNDETIEFIFKELESFSEAKSSAHRKDDFPDCIATAHNAACSMVSYKSVALPSTNSPTKLSTHRARVR